MWNVGMGLGQEYFCVAGRDVRNKFLNFCSVSVRFLKKNSDSVRNEFCSVRFAKTRFGSDSYLLLM